MMTLQPLPKTLPNPNRYPCLSTRLPVIGHSVPSSGSSSENNLLVVLAKLVCRKRTVVEDCSKWSLQTGGSHRVAGATSARARLEALKEVKGVD
jgi:hypothetical protein